MFCMQVVLIDRKIGNELVFRRVRRLPCSDGAATGQSCFSDESRHMISCALTKTSYSFWGQIGQDTPQEKESQEKDVEFSN